MYLCILFEKPNRALIGTYQEIGLLQNDQLLVQRPVKRTESFRISGEDQIAEPINSDELKDAITCCQTASYLFHHKKYNFTK